MREQDEERAVARAHIVTALCVVGIVWLLLTSCRASHTTTDSHTEQATELRQVTREEVAHLTTSQTDSTLHPYKYQFVRYYHIPTGVLEREEIQGEGEVISYTTTQRDTLYIVTSDTTQVASEVTTHQDTTETPTQSHLSTFIWGFAVGVTLTIIVMLFLRFRRL